MILILTSLDAPIPLDSLTVRVQDGYARSNDYNDPALIVPQSFLAGSAPQLRDLHLYSSLHLTFPSWTLRSVANLTVSRSFSATRLLAVLREMPQLEALTISTIQPINILLFNHNTEPIHLDNLNLFVLELGSLPLFTALSDLLLLPKTARRHYKFTLHDDSYFDYVLWDRFSTVLQTTATIASAGFQAMQFRRQPRSSCIRAWTTPVESGLGPPSWPPLDDVFSISIHCTDYGCVYRQHVSYSAFHRLQDLGVALGCDTVETLAVEYGAEPGGSDRPEIPHGCWSTLFGGLPRVHTLRFGEGATDLLVSASCGTDASPTTLKALCLPHLRRVEVTRGTLRLDTLWGWIHYVFAPPAGMDYADVRKHILALLMEPCGGWIDAGCWRCAEHIGGTQYVTESLLMFLLHWRSQGIWVSELELAGCEWDEPETLELLEKLLRMLEPGWDVIVDAVSV
ncbi:hypothetical protein BC834DRAFT_157338 [Gloeopeniophorella convolvens]|nr:hypothetical protein BC834DRAFT_157338 [Gloeopeniophorella convolvens]